MVRLKILDLMTGWGIGRALEEIRETESNARFLAAVVEERKKNLENVLEEAYGYQVNLDKLPVIGKLELPPPIFSQNGKPLKKRTGGSTGKPLHYYSTKQCQGFLWASIIRSWEVVGYRLGDSVAFLGGSSILGYSIKKQVFYRVLNVTPISTFGLSESELKSIYDQLVKKKVSFLYGYSNAIYLLAEFFRSNNLSAPIKGIVCTAEQLSDSSRDYIEEVFGCKVIRQYGVNDGGVSAFECLAHSGYHVITNRCLIDTVNGELISTDLLNYAQPFVRYKVGDLATISYERCTCQIALPRITHLEGRSNDMVFDLDGRAYPSAFFNAFFREFEHVLQWQVLANAGALIINVHLRDGSGEDELVSELSRYVSNASRFSEVSIVFDKPFRFLANGKLKYVMDVSQFIEEETV